MNIPKHKQTQIPMPKWQRGKQQPCDVALMMGAGDGVYLSGGIIPRILDFLDVDKFRDRFEDKGRFREFNAQVPLAIVTAEQPGLSGCVRALNR